MTKHRQFTLVIHNVRSEIQNEVKDYAQKAKEYVMSVEPYPESDGYHLHLFIQYTNPRSFKSVLAEVQRFAKTVTTPRPPGEERDWGRVQCDIMRGKFQQAHDYLKGLTKDKPTGEVISGRTKCCHRRWRWTGCVGNSPLEEFCSVCGDVCPGCCPGCDICDPKHFTTSADVAYHHLLQYRRVEALRKKYTIQNTRYALRQKDNAKEEDLQEASVSGA